MDAKQSDEQNPNGDTKKGSEDSMEITRRFVIQIKEVIEKCLKRGMTKEQMFRRLREKRVHPMITYTVYRELRQQNEEFFKAYYLTAYVNRQIERFNRQLVAYRVLQRQAKASAPMSGPNRGCDGSNPSSSGNNNPAAAACCATTAQAATGSRALSATPLAVAVPGTARLVNHRATTPACQDFGALPGLSRGAVHEFAGPVTQWQAAQHGCHLQCSVRRSAAGPSNAVMAGPRPPPVQGGGLAQHCADQRFPLQQPLQHGGGAGWRFCPPPPSHGEGQLPLALPWEEQQQLLGRQSYQSNGDSQEPTHQSEGPGLLQEATDSTDHEAPAPLA